MIDKSTFFNLLILFFTIFILVNVAPENKFSIQIMNFFCNVKNLFNNNNNNISTIENLKSKKKKYTQNHLNKYLISHINKKIVQKTKDNIKRTNTIIENPLADKEFYIIYKFLKTILNNKKINLKLISVEKNKIKKQILNNSLLYKNIHCKCIYYDFHVVINLELVATEMSKDSIFLGPINMGNKTGVYNIFKVEINKFYPKSTSKTITKNNSKIISNTDNNNFKIKYGDTDKEPLLLSDSIDSLLPDSFKEGYVSSYDISSVINTTENNILV